MAGYVVNIPVHGVKDSDIAGISATISTGILIQFQEVVGPPRRMERLLSICLDEENRV